MYLYQNFVLLCFLALSKNGNGENVFGEIYRRILRDRGLENDYRLRTLNGNSVAFFRGSGGLYLPDYHHEVKFHFLIVTIDPKNYIDHSIIRLSPTLPRWTITEPAKLTRILFERPVQALVYLSMDVTVWYGTFVNTASTVTPMGTLFAARIVEKTLI